MDLKKFRHDHRLTQADLGELFGCVQTHVSAIEAGTRNLTGLQLRLLIEKYGADDIAKYANDDEQPVININMPNNKIQGNSAPVQNGDNNQMTSDAALQVLKQQSDQISKLIDQQDRLIKLLELKQGL